MEFTSGGLQKPIAMEDGGEGMLDATWGSSRIVNVFVGASQRCAWINKWTSLDRHLQKRLQR
jgi:hypothetical protein